MVQPLERDQPLQHAELGREAGLSSGHVRRPPPVPNVEPFAIEPILLARLNRANVRPSIAGLIIAITTLVAVSWSALISNLFYRSSNSKTWWPDLWSFLLHHQTTGVDRSVPYLGDPPSIVLTVTLAASAYLVYAIFCWASVLHSDMESAGCIRYTSAGQIALTEAVNAMNAKFVRWGKFAPMALILAFVGTTVVNFRLEGRLFIFLGKGNLYDHWWASLHPWRPGGVVWVVLGGIGIYLVYAEAVLGLIYVRFLRSCRNDYQFRANMLNPDGLFGWTRLRQIVSNLEAGVFCTLLTSWALSFYLQPALGSVITTVVLTTFGGIVLYVFISVTSSFRKQVKADKDAQRAEIGREIAENSVRSEAESLLRVLVAYKRLELVSKIPSVPIRAGWLVAGAITVVVPVTALVMQLLSYFTGK